MSQDELNKIKDELNKLPYYPWHAHSISNDIWLTGKKDDFTIINSVSTANFIAQSPARIEKLIALIEEQRALIAEAEDTFRLMLALEIKPIGLNTDFIQEGPGVKMWARQWLEKLKQRGE